MGQAQALKKERTMSALEKLLFLYTRMSLHSFARFEIRVHASAPRHYRIEVVACNPGSDVNVLCAEDEGSTIEDAAQSLILRLNEECPR
jgi:hypothetical protein